MTPARLVIVRVERGVERDRDDLRRRHQPGDLLVQGDERRAASAIGNEASGRWSKSCSASPGLWTMTIACGVAPWISAEGHRRVGRVVERALALDDDPVAERLALLDQPLDRALGEVADEPIDGDAPALDHHPGLAGRDERRAVAGARAAARRSSSATDILPIAQSLPTVRITRLPGRVAAPDGRLHPVRRTPVVDDRGPSAAAAAANSGSSPRNVWSPDRTSRPAAIAARMIARHDVREPAAGRRDPDQQRVGWVGQGQRLVERRDDRDVVAGQVRADVLARPGRIDDARRRRRGRSG